VSRGDRVELTVDDLAFGGEGVGRVAGFAVFVPFTIPGERVEAEILGVEKNLARARLVRVLAAADGRVAPRCALFGACGGCQYQHLEYAAQLRWKRKQVADLMQRLGGFPPEVVTPVIPCPAPYGYRNRIMVRAQHHRREERMVIGYLRAASREVVDVPHCPIAEPELNAQLARLRERRPERGGLKYVLRLAPAGWEVPPDSFFQNNFHLLPRLVETVRAALREAGVRHLVDAYCGVGFFALEAAAEVALFAGVEIDARAIRAARANAARRGVTNGEFVAGPAEDWLPALLQKFPPARTAVMVDPPRVGCAPSLLAALRATRPAQVLYVSCHPATLARDLRRLGEDAAYTLRRVTPLDMFPQTQHVECVADLRAAG
jgi:tRNA/tmRNA/rRNA uracil-C5-methylase (TrmA/RlmC/RlmD family)